MAPPEDDRPGDERTGDDPPGDERPARGPKGSGAETVYRRLKTDILELSLAPGAVLEESEISRRLGVSRSPVREALVRLSTEGLVESIRNKANVVAQFDIEALPAYFDALAVIYRLTARLAAVHGGEGPAATLAGLQAEHDAAVAAQDPHAVIRCNRAFHDGLAAIGRNPWFRRWQQSLLDQGQRIMRLHVRAHGESVPEEQLDEHRAIIEAVRRRDAEAADAAGARDAAITRTQAMRYMGFSRVDGLSLRSGQG